MSPPTAASSPASSASLPIPPNPLTTQGKIAADVARKRKLQAVTAMKAAAAPPPDPATSAPKKKPRAMSFAPPRERVAQEEAKKERKTLEREERRKPLTTNQKIRAEGVRKRKVAAAEGKPKEQIKGRKRKNDTLVLDVLGQDLGAKRRKAEDEKESSQETEGRLETQGDVASPPAGSQDGRDSKPNGIMPTSSEGKDGGVLMRRTARAQGHRQDMLGEMGMRELKASIDGGMAAVKMMEDLVNAHPEDVKKLVGVNWVSALPLRLLRATTPADESARSPGLLRLPLHLRTRIIRLAVSESVLLVTPESMMGHEQPDLAMTCRQLRSDALISFYSHNIFRIELCSEGANNATMVQKWATAVGVKWLSHVKHWVLSYCPPNAQHSSGSKQTPSEDKSVFVSIRAPRIQANTEKGSPIVEVHGAAGCVLPGRNDFGECVVKTAPAWLHLGRLEMDMADVQGVMEMAKVIGGRLDELTGSRCEVIRESIELPTEVA